MAIDAGESLADRRFVESALADGDHRRDEAAHHVVTERLGANGEPKRRARVRAQRPTCPSSRSHFASSTRR